jgi:hypothetical protein
VKLRVADARRAWEDVKKSIGTDRRQRAEMAARDQLRRWYAAEVKPRLMELQPKDILRAIEVSRTYAREIIAGQIPHRRHFAALAKLVGVPAPKASGDAAELAGAAAGALQSTPDHNPKKERAKCKA